MATVLLASRLSQAFISDNRPNKFQGPSSISGHCFSRLIAGANNNGFSNKAPKTLSLQKGILVEFGANNNGSNKAPKTLSLQKGILVEFQKDSGRVVLGVTQKREGKKNWCIIDQNGDMHTVRPNQINIIVPGTEDYDPQDVSRFLKEVELLQDPMLLELAWEEMITRNGHADIEELALMLYGSNEPETCYSAYRLLSSYPLYFKCKDGGYSPKYEPRPLSQVKELQHQQIQEEKAHQNLMNFVEYVKSIIQLPMAQRPNRNCWDSKEPFRAYLESMRVFALETGKSSELTNSTMRVLEALGFTKTPASAVNLLFQIGYFELHENLHVLKLDIPLNFSTECLTEAEAIKAKPLYDPDMDRRVDLTSLKVYTIDNENPDEMMDLVQFSYLMVASKYGYT